MMLTLTTVRSSSFLQQRMQKLKSHNRQGVHQRAFAVVERYSLSWASTCQSGSCQREHVPSVVVELAVELAPGIQLFSQLIMSARFYAWCHDLIVFPFWAITVVVPFSLVSFVRQSTSLTQQQETVIDNHKQKWQEQERYTDSYTVQASLRSWNTIKRRKRLSLLSSINSSFRETKSISSCQQTVVSSSLPRLKFSSENVALFVEDSSISSFEKHHLHMLSALTRHLTTYINCWLIEALIWIKNLFRKDDESRCWQSSLGVLNLFLKKFVWDREKKKPFVFAL